jgi:hypothetical protein
VNSDQSIVCDDPLLFLFRNSDARVSVAVGIGTHQPDEKQGSNVGLSHGHRLRCCVYLPNVRELPLLNFHEAGEDLGPDCCLRAWKCAHANIRAGGSDGPRPR